MKLRLTVIGCAAAIMICLILLVVIPKEQVASLKVKGAKAEEVLKAENESRTALAQTIATLAQILGGFAVLIGLYFAWENITSTNRNLELTKETTAKNLEIANRNLELTNQNFELSKEGQVAERFTKAIEQLGATDDKGQKKT